MRRTRQSKSLAGKNAAVNLLPVGEIETHEALLNDVVLQNIFKYLGCKDLKSCRSVGNKTWFRNSNKVWWSQTKVTFKHGEKDKLKGYFNQTEISSKATNYKFEFIDENLQRFLDSFGDSIKYLEFERLHFSTVDDFRRIIYTQCPNVEKIVLFNVWIREPTYYIREPLEWQEPQFGEHKNLKYFDADGAHIPVSWMELLSHFPNLQGLKASVDDSGIFKTISTVRQHDPKMLKLKEISVRGHYNDSLRLVYLDPNLPLEKIAIESDNCKVETLQDILEQHANSLKELSVVVRGLTNKEKYVSIRKPLERLEKLSLYHCLFGTDIFKYTPNLRKVKIYFDNHYKWLPNAKSKFSINTCKELELYHNGDGPISAFKFFLTLFPNVEVFETRKLKNCEFSMICERWAKLKSINVAWHSQVDVIGLLGYDPDSKASTRNRKPNITDLKDLETFSVEARQGVLVKNGSVVLKELTKLQHLKKFKLIGYQNMQSEGEIWRKILAKYSRE